MKLLSRCVAATCATLLTLASSATVCTAEPIPERPAYVPSWLWSALYNGKAYPSLNPDDFIVVNGKNIYIGFHYTTGYTFDCDMGSPNDDGHRAVSCLGYMPAMGALPLTRSTYPIPSNKHRILTRIDMSTDSLPVRAEAPAYAVDDGFYDNTPHFPAGHRLYLPKADPQRWKELHSRRSERYNYALVCVSKDTNRFGCLRTDNHGFYLDQYGTHTF